MNIKIITEKKKKGSVQISLDYILKYELHLLGLSFTDLFDYLHFDNKVVLNHKTQKSRKTKTFHSALLLLVLPNLLNYKFLFLRFAEFTELI